MYNLFARIYSSTAGGTRYLIDFPCLILFLIVDAEISMLGMVINVANFENSVLGMTKPGG
jgi:hypothetical protein